MASKPHVDIDANEVNWLRNSILAIKNEVICNLCVLNRMCFCILGRIIPHLMIFLRKRSTLLKFSRHTLQQQWLCSTLYCTFSQFVITAVFLKLNSVSLLVHIVQCNINSNFGWSMFSWLHSISQIGWMLPEAVLQLIEEGSCPFYDDDTKSCIICRLLNRGLIG